MKIKTLPLSLHEWGNTCATSWIRLYRVPVILIMPWPTECCKSNAITLKPSYLISTLPTHTLENTYFTYYVWESVLLLHCTLCQTLWTESGYQLQSWPTGLYCIKDLFYPWTSCTFCRTEPRTQWHGVQVVNISIMLSKMVLSFFNCFKTQVSIGSYLA